MQKIFTTCVTATVLMLLCSCTGMPSQQEAAETHDRFAAYAGEPVDHFTWLGRYDSWQAVGKNEVVVVTNPSEAYLLKVWPPCDMRTVTNRIGISSMGGSVSARTDSVTIAEPGMGRMTCPIEEIRKVNYRQMKADMRAEAVAARAARQQAQSAQ